MQSKERKGHGNIILMVSVICLGLTSISSFPVWAADPNSGPSAAPPPVSAPEPSAPTQNQSGGGMQSGMHIKEVCGVDIKQFCSNVQPGSGRIIACLEQHQTEVSAGCHQLIERYQSRKGK